MIPYLSTHSISKPNPNSNPNPNPDNSPEHNCSHLLVRDAVGRKGGHQSPLTILNNCII